MSGCNAPTRNVQNIARHYDEQTAKQRSTPYPIRALPLLNCHGSKKLIFHHVPASMQSTNLYDIYLMLYVQS
jgi:hypothetical protein